MPVRTAQKAHRLLDFLMGLSDARVRRTLEGHGFTEADLDEGWARLIALSKAPVAAEPPSEDLPSELAAWQNRWYPIADVVLRTRYPRVHHVVFLNLPKPDGPEVLVSVRVLLDRLELVGRPEDEGGLGKEGEEALAYLARRGMSAAVIGEARALLARIMEPPPPSAPAVDPEARTRAEAHLWTWYLEWSGIARAVIDDRRALAALGFRPRERKRSE